MAFNLTGYDPELFVGINSILHVLIFLLFPLPNLILSGLCVVALLTSKTLNRKIRVVLANVFVAEITHALSSFFIYLGYPIRASVNDGDITCSIDGSFLFIGTLSSLAAISLYTIVVYVLITVGVKKLKWNVIITYIVVSWGVNILAVLSLTVPRTVEVNVDGLLKSIDGFCGLDIMDTNEVLSTIYTLAAVTLALGVAVSLLLISIFGILTLRYVKKNTIQENPAIKKAIAKNLLYLSIKVFLVVAIYVVFFGFSSLRQYIEERTGDILFVALEYIINYSTFEILSLITPIASLATLQPLRVAVKQILAKLKKMCFCYKSSQVQVSITSETRLSEKQDTRNEKEDSM